MMEEQRDGGAPSADGAGARAAAPASDSRDGGAPQPA
jgi:hypothetical protein